MIRGYKVGSIDIEVSGKIMLLDNGTHSMAIPLRLLDDLLIEMKLAKSDHEAVSEYVEDGVDL